MSVIGKPCVKCKRPIKPPPASWWSWRMPCGETAYACSGKCMATFVAAQKEERSR